MWVRSSVEKLNPTRLGATKFLSHSGDPEQPKNKKTGPWDFTVGSLLAALCDVIPFYGQEIEAEIN